MPTDRRLADMLKDKPKRPIDRDTYLKAKGLYALAQEHAKKIKAFEQALFDLLKYGEDDGWPYMGHISDGIYGNEPLEVGLRKENFVVKPAKRRKAV
jgi:hypothetical protein